MSASECDPQRLAHEVDGLRRRLQQLETENRRVHESLQASLRQCQTYAVLHRLLTLALEDLPLETMLERFIEAITSLSWLALDHKGAIFLVKENGGILTLQAHRGLSSAMVARCAQVPYGRCLCGRAAASGKILFTDHVDDRHDWDYEDMAPHGHYCVPILAAPGRVLGLITLYLKEGHPFNADEEVFLTAVANTLAGIIERKQAQMRLEERTRELGAKSREVEEANIALKVLLRQMGREKRLLEEQILRNFQETVQPYLQALARSALDERQRACLKRIESHTDAIVSPISQRLAHGLHGLTSGETRVAQLIMEGRRTKEIAALLHLSAKTIESHRRNIRRKLGIRRSKTNLRALLMARAG